ncbi:MAG: TIGR01777 family oxidoreductase [Deltaproteobacteria bacterium]|nr:TIGR01777 family oxidoreductase [Deltaproteobacteria bacterium]
MHILITGGTGFVGTHLCRTYLDKGWQVTATGTSGEHPFAGRENFECIRADTTKSGDWQRVLKNVDVVVNLAGRSIFNYWTADYKTRMHDSRILTTRNLVEALEPGKNVTLLSASAAGYYGDRGDDPLEESEMPGDDFLAGICREWEKEALQAREKGARVMLMRFGVVLGKGGGALGKMLPAFKLLVGGPLGSGRHWFPWIHLDDLASATIFLMETADAEGPFNFCAPQVVRYKTFAATLGRVLGRPSFVKMPAFVLKLLAGEMGAAMLNSQRAVPARLERAGFSFRYPELKNALQEIV